LPRSRKIILYLHRHIYIHKYLLKGLDMPFIRVNCPTGALTADQKAKLAPRLVRALIRQEIDPVTEIGTAATGFFFNEINADNCFPGGVPLSEHPERVFWTVEAFVAASFFSQPRRDEMQTDIAKAFVEILGDDGTALEREDIRITPAYLMRLHVVVVEIPEGSWGAGGQTIDTEKISKLIGATQGPKRLAEARENAARLKTTRVS
jgi:phenylpyruvate tautomerase PptA (4-oxalocrotonate tautomerase family)